MSEISLTIELPTEVNKVAFVLDTQGGISRSIVTYENGLEQQKVSIKEMLIECGINDGIGFQWTGLIGGKPFAFGCQEIGNTGNFQEGFFREVVVKAQPFVSPEYKAYEYAYDLDLYTIIALHFS